MKRLITLFLVLGLLACATVANAQEVLTNAKMNALDPAGTQQLGQTPSDWIVDAERGADLAYNDAVASEGFANIDAGGTSGVFFKAFTGNPPWDPTLGDVDVDIYQDNPGTPGMKYILKAWWGSEPNWSGHVDPSTDNAQMALDFLGIGGLPIGSAVLDLDGGLAANLGNGNPLNYAEYMVMAFAPAGTVTVRARGTMNDGVFNMDPGQALVTDCWSLVCIPEPASVMLGLIGMLGVVGLGRRR